MRVNQNHSIRTAQVPRGGDMGSRIADQAMCFRGQPYVWGGGHGGRTGIQPVDCSGLVSQAARMAGVSFDGTARDQQRRAHPIGLGHLSPGDLVFRGHPAHHVGVYIGNGQVLHSPRPGQSVKTTGLGGWTSAGRIPGVNGGSGHARPAGQHPRTGNHQRNGQHQPIRHHGHRPAGHTPTTYHRAPHRAEALGVPVEVRERHGNTHG